MILFASGLWFEIDLKDNVLSFEWLVYYPCLSQQVRKFAVSLVDNTTILSSLIYLSLGE